MNLRFLKLLARYVLDELWDLIESVSKDFPTYSFLPGGGESVRFAAHRSVICAGKGVKIDSAKQ